MTTWVYLVGKKPQLAKEVTKRHFMVTSINQLINQCPGGQSNSAAGPQGLPRVLVLFLCCDLQLAS